MKTLRPSRLLAASLGLTVLAGCNGSPLSSLTKVTGSAVTKATNTPFVSNAAAALKLTSTSEVASKADAKALASNDEGMVETSSAALEASEAAASYAIASIKDDMAAAEAGYDGGRAPRDGQDAPPAPPGDRPEAADDEQAPTEGDARPQPRQGQQQPQRPQQQQVQRGGRNGMGRFGDFEMGAFGGGVFAGMKNEPKIERHAQCPEQAPELDVTETKAVQKRQAAGQQVRKDFVKEHPKYSEDEAMIQQVLTAQAWQKTDDETLLSKSGTATLTLGTGVSRKIAVLRVIQAAKPHALTTGQTDIADVYADGATKTVHWEKILQEDGSYEMAYHHEFVTAKGVKFVADWAKTLSADGKLTGSGSFTQTDADGNLVAKETLSIGGNDTDGQSITTTATTDAGATADTSTTEDTSATEDDAADTDETTETSARPEAVVRFGRA